MNAIDSQSVSRFPALEDPTTYEWYIKLGAGARIRYFVAAISGAIGLTLVVLVLPLTLLAYWVPSVSFFLSIIATLIALGLYGAQHVVLLSPDPHRRLLAKFNLPMLSIWPTAALLSLLISPFVRSSLGGSVPADLGQQLLMVADTILDVILLGVPQAYDVHLASIAPTSLYASTILAAFKIIITIGALELVFLFFRLSFGGVRFQGTAIDAAYACRTLPNFAGFLIGYAELTPLQVPVVARVGDLRQLVANDFSPPL